MDDKADDAPEQAELAAAMSCIQRILLDGLRHGHFRYEISGSIGKNLRREVAALDYVILHEMAHFVSPRHDDVFLNALDRNMPGWRQIRADLNALPLSE